MKSRGIVGRKIVRIVLDDGSRVAFSVAELEGDYAVEGTHYKHKKEG